MMHTGAADNKMNQAKIIIPLSLAVVTLTASGVTLARTVTVGGGVTAGYEFEDRQYEDDSSDQEQQQTAAEAATDERDERYSRMRLAPLVTLTSTDAHDELELRYSPSFWYDFETSDNNVDHDLRAAFERFLTRHWQVRLADNYVLTDEHRYSLDTTDRTAESSEPTATSDTAPTRSDTVRLTDTENRRRYWTNDLSLRSEYEYAQDSTFALGYRYNILNNIDTDDRFTYEDYDRHEVVSELAHRFDAVWRLSVFGSYARGLFDEAGSSDAPVTDTDTPVTEEEVLESDLNEYTAGTMLQEKYLEHHLHTLSYRYYGTDYDEEQRSNAYIHDVTLGWQWDIARDTVFALGAGPSYIKIEDTEGEWDYNANMLLVYAFERGHLRLSAGRGFEVLNFTGTEEDNGMREYWVTRLSVDYQLLDNLTGMVHVGYRNEEQDVTRETAATAEQGATAEGSVLSETESLERERFSTGASLEYSFQQWYKLTASYDYIQQDSEFIDDSFDEHRVGLALSYETDLLKW